MNFFAFQKCDSVVLLGLLEPLLVKGSTSKSDRGPEYQPMASTAATSPTMSHMSGEIFGAWGQLVHGKSHVSTEKKSLKGEVLFRPASCSMRSSALSA